MLSTVGSTNVAEPTRAALLVALGRDVSAALPRPDRSPRGGGSDRAAQSNEVGSPPRGDRSHPGAPALRGALWAYRMRPRVTPEVNKCVATDSNSVFTF